MAYFDPGRRGPPAWLVFLAAGALVIGGYLIWQGLQSFLASGLRGVMEATQVAQATATAYVQPTSTLRFTPAPTWTPVPPCQPFRVTVPEAIIRECASTRCAIRDVRHEGDEVCVLERDPVNTEWYRVDLEASAFFLDLAFMHESVIRAVNPTATPSRTMTPLPTLTPVPSDTPLPTPPPTFTANPATPPTVTPTFTSSPTPPLISG